MVALAEKLVKSTFVVLCSLWMSAVEISPEIREAEYGVEPFCSQLTKRFLSISQISVEKQKQILCLFFLEVICLSINKVVLGREKRQQKWQYSKPLGYEIRKLILTQKYILTFQKKNNLPQKKNPR